MFSTDGLIGVESPVTEVECWMQMGSEPQRDNVATQTDQPVQDGVPVTQQQDPLETLANRAMHNQKGKDKPPNSSPMTD